MVASRELGEYELDRPAILQPEGDTLRAVVALQAAQKLTVGALGRAPGTGERMRDVYRSIAASEHGWSARGNASPGWWPIPAGSRQPRDRPPSTPAYRGRSSSAAAPPSPGMGPLPLRTMSRTGNRRPTGESRQDLAVGCHQRAAFGAFYR